MSHYRLSIEEALSIALGTNGTYLSPRYQNDTIRVIRFDLIGGNIVRVVKEVKFYSVLADEIWCHNVERLPVCL